MRLICLALAVLLPACTSVEFVRKDLSPEKRGILRYASTSSASRKAKARDKVTEKATAFCGGPFQITKEYQARQDTGSGVGVGTGVGFGGGGGVMLGTSSSNTDLYNFVEFICGKK